MERLTDDECPHCGPGNDGRAGTGPMDPRVGEVVGVVVESRNGEWLRAAGGLPERSPVCERSGPGCTLTVLPFHVEPPDPLDLPMTV